MPAVALSPKAGAHGELCGMMAIRAAHEARGRRRKRKIVLVPESAHGTNPATAACMGYQVKPMPAREDGTVARRGVKAALGPDVAAIMLTNPNTCGLFEPRDRRDRRGGARGGAYFYCDGANFNAIVGKVRPGDLGIDAMHINLHKTFSTPHGGGGPGAGPGGAVGSAGAVRAAAVSVARRARRFRSSSTPTRRRGRRAVRPHHRLPRPDGHVRARAHLHAEPRRRRPAAGVRGRGAQRQLHTRRASRRA